jgi:hypothetical protein
MQEENALTEKNFWFTVMKRNFLVACCRVSITSKQINFYKILGFGEKKNYVVGYNVDILK